MNNLGLFILIRFLRVKSLFVFRKFYSTFHTSGAYLSVIINSLYTKKRISSSKNLKSFCEFIFYLPVFFFLQIYP